MLTIIKILSFDSYPYPGLIHTYTRLNHKSLTTTKYYRTTVTYHLKSFPTTKLHRTSANHYRTPRMLYSVEFTKMNFFNTAMK